MSSSIKLKNANGKTLSVTNSNANQTDKEVIYLNTVDELANASGSTNAVAIVSDLSRGGTFEWSATGTANGGTVFAGVSGYWNRQYSGAVNVKWFGAKGDGATDDTAAIQAAVDAGSNVVFPSGNYVVTSIVIPASSNITGNATIISTGTGFNLNGNNIKIDGLRFDGGIAFTTTSNSYYLTLSNIFFVNCSKAFECNHQLYWSSFSNITIRECSEGFKTTINQAMNASSFSNINTFHSAPTGKYAFDFTNQDGISFSNLQIQNIGIKLSGCKHISIYGGYIEGYIENVLYVESSSISISNDVHFLPATLSYIDNASYLISNGFLPNKDNKYASLKPVNKSIDHYGSGLLGIAVNDIKRLSTGFVVALSGGFINCTSSTSSHLIKIYGKSFYMKITVVSNSITIRTLGGTYDTVETYGVGTHYIRLTTSGTYMQINPSSSIATEFNIEEISKSDSESIIANPASLSSIYNNTNNSTSGIDYVFCAPSVATTVYSLTDAPDGRYMITYNESNLNMALANGSGLITKRGSKLVLHTSSSLLSTLSVSGLDIRVTVASGQPNTNITSYVNMI